MQAFTIFSINLLILCLTDLALSSCPSGMSAHAPNVDSCSYFSLLGDDKCPGVSTSNCVSLLCAADTTEDYLRRDFHHESSSGVRLTKNQCCGTTLSTCSTNPCSGASCPGFSNAQCEKNRCGDDCTAEWFVTVSGITYEVTSGCSSGSSSSSSSSSSSFGSTTLNV